MSGQAPEIDYKAIDINLLKRLIVFLKPYIKYVIIALGLTISASALGPLRPYLSKIAIDKYIALSDYHGLLTIILIVFGLLLLHAALQYGLTYIMQWVGQKVLYDIRNKVFTHIQSLALRFYDKNPVGRLVTRVTNDVEALNELFSSGVVMIIADILLIFWIIGFMFYTNWELALLTLSVMPLLLLSISIFRRKVRIVYREIRAKVSELNSYMNEYITGISTIKLFAQEKKRFAGYDKINLEHKILWIRTIFYYSVFFPIVEMFSAIGLGILIWYSAGNILSGAMTVGTLIAFMQYWEMLYRPIRDLTEKYTTLQSAMAASERIFGMLDTQEKIEEESDAIELPSLQKGIEFKNISFSYDGSKEVLRNVSFEVKKGSTTAIVGATGAGKTSIINLLCRFYEEQSGEIFIDGINIRKIKKESLLEKIALVMQDVFLFSRTVADNISLGNEKIDSAAIRRAAAALGASEFIERLPNSYDTAMTERGSTLSAGQRQLIAFCRAYAAEPEILILDEATSNIDSETEQVIEKSLAKLLEGRTSIIIAHRLSTIKRADQIIVLHNGKVRETGTHSELLEKKGLYSRLYMMQRRGEEVT